MTAAITHRRVCVNGIEVTAFERSGFTGALSRYRNLDRDWADFSAPSSTPILPDEAVLIAFP